MRNDKLRVKWSKRERDLIFYYPRQSDGSLAHTALASARPRLDYETGRVVFDPSFVDELESRGYDMSTLKFEIQLKAQPGTAKLT